MADGAMQFTHKPEANLNQGAISNGVFNFNPAKKTGIKEYAIYGGVALVIYLILKRKKLV